MNPTKAVSPCDRACPLDGRASDPSRRQFLTGGLLATIALTLAACAGSDNPTAPSGMILNGTINLSTYPALATVGGVAYVTVSGASLAIVRTGEDTFVALSRSCPHEGTTVNTSSTGFTCPRHGAQFDRSGTWTGGQRTSSLTHYPVQYDATAGTLTIGG